MSKQRPWLAAVLAMVEAAAVYRGYVRPWMYGWGATAAEAAADLPGDELVEPDARRTTRAIGIAAPVERVWPWLAQIGEDRGGFYSYSLLERAVGANIHNAATVHAEWQDLRVGDTVWLARRFGERARQVVAAVEPRSHLVLVSGADFERIALGERATGSWSLHLLTRGAGSRLIIRGSGGAVGHAVFDVPHFIMERAMMLGIRRRAERPQAAAMVVWKGPADAASPLPHHGAHHGATAREPLSTLGPRTRDFWLSPGW
jgi:hypothetical protein